MRVTAAGAVVILREQELLPTGLARRLPQPPVPRGVGESISQPVGVWRRATP